MSEPVDDDPLEQAWLELQSDWDREEKHKAFVQLANASGRLAEAGAKYKRAVEDPARSEGAERGRKLVLGMAMAQIDAMPRTSRDEARRTARWFVPLASMALLLASNFLLSAWTGRRVFVSPALIAVEIVGLALLPWSRILR